MASTVSPSPRWSSCGLDNAVCRDERPLQLIPSCRTDGFSLIVLEIRVTAWVAKMELHAVLS